MRKIDKTDRKLLQAVQENALLTAEQLGEACGLSPTAALKRRKKLRSDGVIERDSAVVSPRALGFDIMALVMVTLDREDRGVIDGLIRTSATRRRSPRPITSQATPISCCSSSRATWTNMISSRASSSTTDTRSRRSRPVWC